MVMLIFENLLTVLVILVLDIAAVVRFVLVAIFVLAMPEVLAL